MINTFLIEFSLKVSDENTFILRHFGHFYF